MSANPALNIECSAVAFQLLLGYPQIAFADDVGSLKDSPSLMAGQLHGYAFRDTRSGKVPDCTTPQIMKDPTGTASLPAGSPPCLVARESSLSHKEVPR